MNRGSLFLHVCAGIAAVSLIIPAANAQVIMRGGRVMDGGGSTASSSSLSGLHIPQGKRINFTHVMTDGAGFRWDIQYYGSVGQGTNYAYSSACYSQINGNNFNSNGQGWANEAGDEVELGPWQYSNVRMHRRIKVYKDQGLARWLDIYENTTANPVELQVQNYTNFNWQLARQVSSTGQAAFGEKDWAFVTEQQETGNNTPATMHWLCDKRSKLRPTVQVQGNQIYVRYRVTVPANGTAILCYFEKQDQNVADLTKSMKELRAGKLLRDLPSGVRRLIVNFPSGGGLGDVDLEREGNADLVLLTDGDPIRGQATNTEFEIETLFGKLTVPAAKVLGMAGAENNNQLMRIVLADGQVVSGKMLTTALKLTLPTGGDLEIPFERIGQWSYRVSEQRPLDIEVKDRMVVLRSGDRLAMAAEGAPLKFRTAYGLIDLEPASLISVELEGSGNGLHRAKFLNGSVLSGLLEPAQIEMPLKLGSKLTIARDMVRQFYFQAEPEEETPALSILKLRNGDELAGQLLNERLKFTTDFGALDQDSRHIQKIEFMQDALGRATVAMWDSTILRGRVEETELVFRLEPGPTLKIHPDRVVAIHRSQAMPPSDMTTRVRQLVAQLGAESYQDREKATQELRKMPKGVIPLLRSHLKDNDPEVRQRIENIIQRLESGGDGGGETSVTSVEGPMMFIK